ncbi:MAG TPA: TIR domain-containing protein [Nitrososphaeraceae archaeon]|nr:TIR domain-containing protein [Nitrososphaeraceae archaeon]
MATSASNKITVFISYADEDAKSAERLYDDLKNVGLVPWQRREDIKPGQKWQIVIRKAIRNSRYFIPLLSSSSIKNIGFIQKEFKYAIDYADTFPESEIYIIPARLDACQIPYQKLEEIQPVDLFPDWNKGVSQMLLSMDIDFNKNKTNTIQENKEQWRMGLLDEDWKKLLKSIYEKKCIPFVGPGIYTVQSEDGKMLLPSTKSLVEKWKEEHSDPLEDLYELARVYILEDSHQLARLAQFLEIESAGQKKPKKMLSDMIKKIELVDFNSQFENSPPYNILAGLDLPIYITTNYDKFLEDTISKSPNKEAQSGLCRWNDGLIATFRPFGIASVLEDEEENQYKPSTEKPLVYHILGHVDYAPSMVLTERDYFEYVINLNKNEEKDMIPSVIRKELGLSSLLFIGYSLDDINFRVIFQGFLSFLNALPKDFRELRLHVAMQVPPVISKRAQIRMQEYLDEYTGNMFNLRIYWGSTYNFLKDLSERWQEFKNNNDMKSYMPLK